jgi:hypothetical protein
MNRAKLYKVSGIASVIIGILAACSLYNFSFVFYGLLLAIIGFILAGINIFLDAKHGMSGKKYPVGYLGMVFSSIPVLFLMYMIFSHR